MVIPYGRQDITQDDIDSVVEVLRSDWLTQGPAVPRFEQAIAELCDVKYAVSVNSATSALHIACLALDLCPNDWLWTTPNTFVASANCGLYCGAKVDFVDIEPQTLNICLNALAAKLEKAEREGRLPKVVIPVHFSGRPCDMAQIAALGSRYGFRIIEDASHAIGAWHGGKPVGHCAFSDITVFSFHPVKIITSGEGGLATTNDSSLAERMTRLRSHGITRDPSQMVSESDGGWYYQQIELGFNYRITDLQAALGSSQLRRIDAFAKRRYQLAARYDSLLADLPELTKPSLGLPKESAWHLYVVHAPKSARNTIFDFMRASGIGVNIHYIPVHLHPHYRKLGFNPGDFPEAEQHYATTLSLPLFPRLTEFEQSKVVNCLREAL